MATKTTKTPSFGAPIGSLAAGAAAAYKNYGVETSAALNKNVAANNLKAKLESKAQKNQLNSEIQANIARLGDVSVDKIAPEHLSMYQEELSSQKQAMGQLANQRAMLISKYGYSPADPAVTEIDNQISEVAQRFKIANKEAEEYMQIKQEFLDNGGNLSNAVPNEYRNVMKKLFTEEGQHTSSFRDGKVYYKVDGKEFTLGDITQNYMEPDSIMGTQIIKASQNFYNSGFSGKKLSQQDKDAYYNDVMANLEAGGVDRVASILNDDIVGLNQQLFSDEEVAQIETLPYKEQQKAIANRITERQFEVHQKGLDEYNAKQGDGEEDNIEVYEAFGDVGKIPVAGGYHFKWEGNRYVKVGANGDKVQPVIELTNARDANRFFQNIKFKS
jgi:hypothetical protein